MLGNGVVVVVVGLGWPFTALLELDFLLRLQCAARLLQPVLDIPLSQFCDGILDLWAALSIEALQALLQDLVPVSYSL